MKNSASDQIFSYDYIVYSKNSARFSINYSISDNINLKNIVEYLIYTDGDKNDSQGYFISQDVHFKPARKPYSITVRYALFDTDGYDSRIYAYENDILYAFSVPAFSGKGMRIYMLAKMKVFDSLNLYAKIGRTVHPDLKEIGNDLTLIPKNHKTDLKIEVIWKF
jgi:hypothetical protein